MKSEKIEGWLSIGEDPEDYNASHVLLISMDTSNNPEICHCCRNPINTIITPLCEHLKTALCKIERECWNKKIPATIRYHITSEKKTFEELNENIIRKVCGADLDIKYSHHYSDLTGYLWTDENFIVNNHDIIKEIQSIFIEGNNDKFYGIYGVDKNKRLWFTMEVSIGYA